SERRALAEQGEGKGGKGINLLRKFDDNEGGNGLQILRRTFKLSHSFSFSENFVFVGKPDRNCDKTKNLAIFLKKFLVRAWSGMVHTRIATGREKCTTDNKLLFFTTDSANKGAVM